MRTPWLKEFCKILDLQSTKKNTDGISTKRENTSLCILFISYHFQPKTHRNKFKLGHRRHFTVCATNKRNAAGAGRKQKRKHYDYSIRTRGKSQFINQAGVQTENRSRWSQWIRNGQREKKISLSHPQRGKIKLKNWQQWTELTQGTYLNSEENMELHYWRRRSAGLTWSDFVKHVKRAKICEAGWFSHIKIKQNSRKI